MAKGAKQKGSKTKKDDEPKAPKAQANTRPASRTADRVPSRVGFQEREDVASFTEAPALMTRHGHDSGGYGAGGGGSWGGNTNSASWDLPQSQLLNEPPQTAPFPSNKTTYGSTAQARHSPSIADGGAFTQNRHSFEDGYESEERHDRARDWDDPPLINAPPSTIPLDVSTAPPSGAHSPAARDSVPMSLSPMAAAELARAELKSKPISSASAAAKKAEAGNPALAGNRDSVWSKTHEAAANRADRHNIFQPGKASQGHPQARPRQATGNGPKVDDKLGEDPNRPTFFELKVQPAWMQWGAGQRPPPAEPPQPPPKAKGQSKAAREPAKHKKGAASWQHWNKMAPARPTYVPPSDESSEEDDWDSEEDWEEGEDWGRGGHAMPQHGGRGGAWPAGVGGGKGRGGFDGSDMGGPRKRPGGDRGGGGWPDPDPGASGGWGKGGHAGGGGGWGKEAGGGGGWGNDPSGGWDNPSSTGFHDGWGQAAGSSHQHTERGRGVGGRGMTSKVTFASSVEDASGSRNNLSSKERTQIFNSLLTADLQQKGGHPMSPPHPAHRGRQSEDHHGAWGGASGGVGDWEAQHMPKGKKTRHKQDEAGPWGAWGAPEDDHGGGGHLKDKKKKKKDDNPPWGALGQQDDGWGAGPETGGWGKPADAGGWGVAPDTGSWGAAGGGDDGWDRVPGDKKSKTKSKKQEPQHAGWGEVTGGWGGVDEDEEGDDDGWGHSNVDQSWGGWKEEDHGGRSKGAWGDEGWGDEDKENEHRVRFAGSGMWGSHAGTSHSMPMSKTMAMANGSHGLPATAMHNVPMSTIPQDAASIKFLESGGAAFKSAENAFFGKSRAARDRFHWNFPPDKDERVSAMMTCIQTVSYGLGALGLHKFLQSQERGALITNAAFRMPDQPNQPVFDWVPFDVLQTTMEKTLQQSVAFYDPAQIVLVFVYLPSHTGNSVAIWRRKLPVPGNVRTMLQKDINIVKRGLRAEKDYVIYLDEVPKQKPKRFSKAPSKVQDRTPSIANPKGKLLTKQLQAQLHAQQPPLGAGKGKKVVPAKAKPAKKRKWWHIFSNL